VQVVEVTEKPAAVAVASVAIWRLASPVRVPGLVMETRTGVAADLTAVVGKMMRVPGVGTMAGATAPVPLRATTAGEPPREETRAEVAERDPVKLPDAAGSKSTATVQVAAAARVEEQVVAEGESWKPGVRASWRSGTGDWPELVSCTESGELGWAMTVAGKLS
jgi:hypothetical protein